MKKNLIGLSNKQFRAFYKNLSQGVQTKVGDGE